MNVVQGPGQRVLRQEIADHDDRVRGLLPKIIFVTGTGRCGTMLACRLLSLSPRVQCEHESCFRHESMMSFHTRGDRSGYADDIDRSLEPRRQSLQRLGKVLGISSGHLYFAIPQLYERYGEEARFILLVRRPEQFARSAAARGFFDPSHPNPCHQIEPHRDEEIHERWVRASPLERTLWYWALVNQFVLDAFATMSAGVCRIIRIEQMRTNLAMDLCRFVGINDVEPHQVSRLLAQRVNASPGEPDAIDVNPHSTPISMPPVDGWTSPQRRLLVRYTDDLRRKLYRD